LVNIKNMDFDILPNEIIVLICRCDPEVYNTISQLSHRHNALSKVIKNPKKWFSRHVIGLHYEYTELPNGDLHGCYVTYRESDVGNTNKIIKSVRHYDSGVAHGIFVDFNENNIAILRGEYLNGLYHGRFTYYRADGSVCCIVNYQHGILDGPQTYYYENGTVHNYYIIKQNKYTVYREYLPDGTLNHQFNS